MLGVVFLSLSLGLRLTQFKRYKIAGISTHCAVRATKCFFGGGMWQAAGGVISVGKWMQLF